MSKKRKSSEVLEEALKLIENGTWRFVCAAIQDVELDVLPKQKSQAMARFQRLKPKHISDNMKMTQEWWPRNEKEPRIDALKKCIELAKKEKD